MKIPHRHHVINRDYSKYILKCTAYKVSEVINQFKKLYYCFFVFAVAEHLSLIKERKQVITKASRKHERKSYIQTEEQNKFCAL